EKLGTPPECGLLEEVQTLGDLRRLLRVDLHNEVERKDSASVPVSPEQIDTPQGPRSIDHTVLDEVSSTSFPSEPQSTISSSPQIPRSVSTESSALEEARL